MKRFEVLAEMQDGKTVVLRRFESREEAEDHPVVMKHWRRVWVAERDVTAAPLPDVDPPFPWTVEWTGGFAYVVDADGRRIASLLGSQKRREFVASVIYEVGR